MSGTEAVSRSPGAVTPTAGGSAPMNTVAAAPVADEMTYAEQYHPEWVMEVLDLAARL